MAANPYPAYPAYPGMQGLGQGMNQAGNMVPGQWTMASNGQIKAGGALPDQET